MVVVITVMMIMMLVMMMVMMTMMMVMMVMIMVMTVMKLHSERLTKENVTFITTNNYPYFSGYLPAHSSTVLQWSFHYNVLVVHTKRAASWIIKMEETGIRF